MAGSRPDGPAGRGRRLLIERRFQYHDQFGTIGNGRDYGAVTVAPDSGTALPGQPVEDPAHPVRAFTADSMKTFLVPLNGATTVSPGRHDAGCGSFQAKWTLPDGGSLLGKDLLWETRVRYVTPPYFWFAIWTAGNGLGRRHRLRRQPVPRVAVGL